VRRLLTVSAVAVILLAAFALMRTIFARVTAAQMGAASSSGMGGALSATSGAGGSSKIASTATSANGAAIVVATGVSARALTIHGGGPHDLLYYTDPFTPNRVLSLVAGDSGGNLLTAVSGTGVLPPPTKPVTRGVFFTSCQS